MKRAKFARPCAGYFPGLLAGLLLMFAAAATALSQPTGSRGRDFWLAFPPNYHPNGNVANPALRLEDSLYIYVAATAPTEVRFSYRNISGTRFNDTITITNTTRVYAFSVPWEGFEVEGFNHSGQIITGGGQNEQPAPQTFHVTSDHDISVYALSQARTTSDAFLVLPTPVLGIDHYVMAYNSDGFFDNFNNLTTQITPSQFVVVATQDNTQIEVFPTTPSHRSGMSVKRATLNAGQAYLVQARITSDNLQGDMTGSRVVSSKPVAVFGGHQRATLPVQLRSELTSRDCLIEQIPAVEVWGKSAFLVPYPTPNGASSIGSDIFRVMAAFDSTPVIINGTERAVLRAGQFYENRLTAPGTVTSTKPVLVAQFKKTSGEQGGPGNNLRLGDPFMMLIPPAEQFLTFYRCINAQAYQVSSGNSRISEPVYENQFITVVAPNTTLGSVRIDGAVVPLASFVPIQNSGFSYSWQSVRDGTHTVEADEPIGIYVYGYGLANSYGYVGDMNFRAFDYRPPQIVSDVRCFEVRGVWYDSTRGDTRLESVVAPPDSQVNMAVVIEPFVPYRDSVSFRGRLIDIYRDGELLINARDSAGLTNSARIPVPGFTLRAANAAPPAAAVEIRSDAPVSKHFCRPVVIANYGAFPQTITAARFRGAASPFRTASALPLTIPAGATAEITVCFFTSVPGVFSDTLDIINDCAGRTAALYRLRAIADTLPPDVSKSTDTCATVFSYIINELLPSDVGIAVVELVENSTKNCAIITDFGPDGLTVRAEVSVSNIYEDAYYLLRIADSAGNVLLFSDTIPGLTVTVSSLPEPSDGVIYFDSTQLRQMTCDTVTIYNYGRFTLHFDQISPVGNILFSAPQTQFPITLASGEHHPLILCYTPVRVGDKPDYDTLRFGLRCLTRDFLLRGVGTAILRSGGAGCEISVVSRSVSAPSAFYLDPLYPHPVPAGGAMSVQFGLQGAADAELTIYDARGVRRLTPFSGRMSGGSYSALIETGGLPAGLYCCVLTAGGEIVSRPFIIQ